MTRRSLKEAIQASALVEELELKNFVFGNVSSTNTTSAQTDTPKGERSFVPLSSIHRTFSFTPDRQPLRHYYDTEQLRQWAESDIAINGIQSPLWVRPLPEGSPHEYELVAGLRRYLAAEALKIEDIPVIIRNWTDSEAFQASLSENTNRRDFSPLEHLDGTLKLLAVKLNCKVETVVSLLYRMNNEAKGNANQNVLVSPQYEVVKAVFDFLGQTTWQSFVSARLPLLKKPEDILEAIRTGKIEYTKGLAIAKLKDQEQRQALLQETITQNLSLTKIRERTEATKPKLENATLKNQFADVYKRVKRAKVWNDPKKQKRLQKLLAELEQLTSEE